MNLSLRLVTISSELSTLKVFLEQDRTACVEVTGEKRAVGLSGNGAELGEVAAGLCSTTRRPGHAAACI